MTAHNPVKRAQAAGFEPVRLTPESSGGRCSHDSVTGLRVWIPVQGPHLKVIRKSFARSRTGVVGVGYGHKGPGGPNGFVVNMGSKSRFFNINRLGRSEAFRLAVKARAQWEQRIEEINQAILAARGGGKA